MPRGNQFIHRTQNKRNVLQGEMIRAVFQVFLSLLWWTILIQRTTLAEMYVPYKLVPNSLSG
jgi:hypothetical protein